VCVVNKIVQFASKHLGARPPEYLAVAIIREHMATGGAQLRDPDGRSRNNFTIVDLFAR
jgi:hypothetical protein